MYSYKVMGYKYNSPCHICCRFLYERRRLNVKPVMKRIHTCTDDGKKTTRRMRKKVEQETSPLDPHVLNETLTSKDKKSKNNNTRTKTSNNNKIDIQKLVAFMFDEPVGAGSKTSARDRIDSYGRSISKQDFDIEDLLNNENNNSPYKIDQNQLEKTIKDRNSFQQGKEKKKTEKIAATTRNGFMADIPQPLALKLAIGNDYDHNDTSFKLFINWINKYRKEYLTLGPDDVLITTKINPIGINSPYNNNTTTRINDDLFSLLLSIDNNTSTWSLIGNLQNNGWYLIGGRNSSIKSIPPLLVFSRFNPNYLLIKRYLFIFSSMITASIVIRILFV